MDPYVGPATVIIDGDEHEVAASLWPIRTRHPTPARRGRRRSAKGGVKWDGLLAPATEAAAWAIRRALDPELKLPNGRRGSFTVCTKVAELIPIEIRGNGAQPF
ncbi:hypothetical protein ABZ896_10230 [Streptomyces sp. NPDC047072]|uniref:hypothetical protein n=1 Tax=Streptomyces sp. NPDC047072 TaxID=3154809 RepID=UPI0033E69355